MLYCIFRKPSHCSSISAVCREEKERAAAAAADAAEAQSAPAAEGKEAAEKAAKKLEGNARWDSSHSTLGQNRSVVSSSLLTGVP